MTIGMTDFLDGRESVLVISRNEIGPVDPMSIGLFLLNDLRKLPGSGSTGITGTANRSNDS